MSATSYIPGPLVLTQGGVTVHVQAAAPRRFRVAVFKRTLSETWEVRGSTYIAGAGLGTLTPAMRGLLDTIREASELREDVCLLSGRDRLKDALKRARDGVGTGIFNAYLLHDEGNIVGDAIRTYLEGIPQWTDLLN